MAKKAIKSVNLLPEFLRTDKNSKFLSSTIDQLIQPAQLERIDGYIGTKVTPTYDALTDYYLTESSSLRTNYQLEPAMVVSNVKNEVIDVIGFDDLINEVATEGGKNDNLDRLFQSTVYSYNPHIDWDKLVNYQEYFWLVNGPETVLITGQQKNTTSTYSIRDNEIGSSFIFNPNGLIEDPIITLYRGSVYNFEIDSSQNFYIKIAPSLDSSDLYNYGITNNGTSQGTITVSVNKNTPDILYYISGDNLSAQGKFLIKDIVEDSAIDVEHEILGKKNYISGTGVRLTNGMKVRFGGDVYPEYYRDKDFFVEGVGRAIVLVEYNKLSSAESMTSFYNENFDATNFDDFPFDNFKNLPIEPEYITINRASRDLNPWSRYNRWVHKEVIRLSAEINGQVPVYPANKRAKRPIIEFTQNLKLFNFGTVGLKNIDLIDNVTLDAFSDVEGTAGYYVDGVLLEQGHRVIFNADTDSTVRGKVYEVNYNILNSKLRLELKPAEDFSPNNFASVSVNLGETYKGTNWWFNGDAWQYSQQHTKLNQAPLFDLFDNSGNSYADKNYYLSDFSGNKIFSYEIGTGTNDPVLGFPLKYKNSVGVGSYLFKNFFTSDTISITENQTVTNISAGITYCKFSDEAGDRYENVWTLVENYRLPILQFQTLDIATSYVELKAIDNPSDTEFDLEVFVDNKKLLSNEYTIDVSTKKCLVVFSNELSANANVLFKIHTNVPPNANGYYESPVSLTNNPLNGNIEYLTLTELSDHLYTMVNKSSEFEGTFPGTGNLRDVYGIEKNGTRLISNGSSMAFSTMFFGKKEHNVVDAISKVADDYNQFKLNFLRKLSEIGDELDTVSSVDTVLKEINIDKDLLSSYYLSDMIAYGTDKTIRIWTVTDYRNVIYPIATDFDPTVLSLRSVLVYLNGRQLLLGTEYQFEVLDSAVKFLIPLTKGDTIEIHDYYSTEGSFVPPTPTKLGLYPKYEPMMLVDETYFAGPINVIQGHDGSITVAYNDFRDDIILEFEKRIFNNIKVSYNSELLDLTDVLTGAFRNTEYSTKEVKEILQSQFIKWAGLYGIEYSTNKSFDDQNPFTWNYKGSYSSDLDEIVSGHWRNIYKYLYDTDRPHTHPWEMLGISIKPNWWDTVYGVAPYTSGNELLWEDLEKGYVYGEGIKLKYARPGLLNLLPVDEAGELVDPSTFLGNITAYNKRQNWEFGDHGPAETAWRRSSYWPFVVQRLLALTKPVIYCAFMYDTSRLTKNIANQYVNSDSGKFLNLQSIAIHDDNKTLTSGYSVLVSELGQQRNSEYIDSLKQDIEYVNFNLFHKVGGFVSKEKLQITIDSIDPTSTGQGVLLPTENYKLVLNVSNPIQSSAISGIVVQKVDGKFVVRGYDSRNPYFNVYTPIRNKNTPTVIVGGVSEPYLIWGGSSSSGQTGLSSAETTTANSAPSAKFYQQGQVVLYGNTYYRVKVSHNAEDTFNSSYYQSLPGVPVRGGASAQLAARFDKIVKKISYGTEYTTLQEVYDLIIGYGDWLKDQGFIFEDYNSDLNSVLDWDLTGKEFLNWTLQNWANNSVITLSPFADKIKYKLPYSVVDNVFDNFYEYSILQANGTPLPQTNVNVSRKDGLCTIETINSSDGIYFAIVNSVQKEHAMVFDNVTKFNDTIYSIETGYRQLRMKFSGFRTLDWNGDYSSPGFVYDDAKVVDWKEYVDYKYGDLVRHKGKYYSAIKNVTGSSTFDATQWTILSSKPSGGLLPNFDYKISQFEDFYSLDIDNFDAGQQKMAQHLTGYTPRVYLNNIFTNPIAQYKFYQGFIKEKGTKNAVSKLAKASLYNLQGELTFTEEWAFRVGQYGSYQTYQEIEVPLVEGTFIENPQVINFVDSKPNNPNDLIFYSTSSDRIIIPDDYVATATFKTFSSTLLENNFELTHAGYARLDDVTATAYNENSLLDIANNRNINEGDVIWLGFKTNGNWDVLKYTKADAKIAGVFVSSPLEEITFVTDIHHGLKVGEIVSISQFNDQVNGVYVVKSLPNLSQFTVASTLASIVNEPLLSPGLLFKFSSSRFDTFDGLPTDKELVKLPDGTKFWVDDAGDGKWAVYQKTKNYDPIETQSLLQISDQRLGFSLYKEKGDDILVVGSPGFFRYGKYGRVSVYSKSEAGPVSRFRFTLNETVNYTDSVDPNEFGYSVEYDSAIFYSTDYGLVIAGAPAASNMKGAGILGGLRYSTGTESPSSRTQEGAVKISSADPILNESVDKFLLLSPSPSTNERFGESLYLQKVPYAYSASLAYNFALTALRMITSSLPEDLAYDLNGDGEVNLIDVIGYLKISVGRSPGFTINPSSNYSLIIQPSKLLLVGAPGPDTPGGVYGYSLGTFSNTSTLNVNYLTTITPPNSVNGIQWGHSISGNLNGTLIAISAPFYPDPTTPEGIVKVYSNTGGTYALTEIATLNSPFESNAKFGDKVLMSPNGDYLFVSATESRDVDQSYGKVAIYKRKTSGVFGPEPDQILNNPIPDIGMKFGADIDVNESVDTLVISALGTNKYKGITFDQSSSIVDQTTFDSKITTFYDNIISSGSVYVYNRKDERFVLSEELPPVSLLNGTNYGYSLTVDDDVIFVGAPAFDNEDTYSSFYQYNKIDTSVDSWVPLRQEEDLVDITTIQKVSLIDTFNDEVVNYLDIIDPLKGKISGLAEQELKYKSAFDPAVYSIGISGTVNDTDTNWLDEHLGELWWDLSTVKYVWYEQGDLTYRKNNWGKLFPGATIDVYEWVGSSYLPSEWSSIADTAAGLTEGISGQPKYADNSVISVKQVYNSASNSFSNYYYYWVKNKVTIPDVRNRRISSYQVASIIADPTAYGLTYASSVARDAIALSNIGTSLIDNRIHLNIANDVINNQIPRHTEWLLLQEGSADSRPNVLLEKKLFDSLLGRDSLGNLVPDPSLSSRVRYGIGIRPQQTLFKDRLEALRNLIEFSNSVLINNRITGNYSFSNLNKAEEIPNILSREYDQIVEDNESLNSTVIDTSQLVTARLSCTVFNGKVRSVSIDHPGFGYKVPPTVIVEVDGGSGAVISTGIDEFGRVNSAYIDNPGSGYLTPPALTVRPYTVIVLADNLFNNKWTKFVYDAETLQWIRSHTQQYNTTLYWKYVDWLSDNYNPYVDYKYTVSDVYEINAIEDILPGDYVKIKNGGLGWYIILEKTKAGISGTFNDDYNIVYSENGTIQLLDSIWNIEGNNFGFDQTSSYDQTLYDQFPDIELQYILSALKNDLFVNDLKVNWNLFFFKAVKYALSEQKLLDWAFKTSFINVRNMAGSLDQRPVYKLTSSTYYEEYLKEVKPYHTNIRSFSTDYTLTEPTRTYTTDFDLPAIYDKDTNQFTPITIDESLIDTYPWKSWKDNYSFEIGSIIVGYPGSGYTVPPGVEIIPADGDTGYGATAKAYIRSGEVVQIEVINPGQGYKKAPRINLVGGGSLTLTPAIVYPQLFNGKVRSNTIGIKFDRTSTTGQVVDTIVTDSFTADGSVNEFVLTWLARPSKSKIKVTVDKVILLSVEYTIDYYTEMYNGYNKRFSKLRLLNFVPKAGQLVEILYEKNIDLMNATDRILSYYTATSGMPGNELGQLMSGIEYPRTKIEGLPFDYSTRWDISYSPFGMSVWADEVSDYTTVQIVSTASIGNSVLEINTTTGVSAGKFINIIGTLNNKFASDVGGVMITEVDTANRLITFDSSLVYTVYPGEELEVWSQNTTSANLDSSIDGGSWSASTSNYLIGALGLNPEDLTIDGSGFYTPESGYSPEELVAGNAIDSVGINVYTKNKVGPPTVFVNNIDVYAGITTTKKLSLIPPGKNYITVAFNGQIFDYRETDEFNAVNQFTINWQTGEIIIAAQPISGKVGYTIVQIGGGTDNDAGIIDFASITTVDSVAQVQSLAAYSTVNSAYVTVNGLQIFPVTTSTSYGFMLTYSNASNKRAAVDVYNLPEGSNTVQAWFFGNEYDYFNEIREQEITVGLGQTVFTLERPPGYIEPYSSQAIVELSNPDGTGRRRLLPPFVSYYEIVDSNKTFRINNQRERPAGSYNIGSNNSKVYLNGALLRPGFDYSLNGTNSTISLAESVGRLGDVVAIVDLLVHVGASAAYEFDFYIENDKLYLNYNLDLGSRLKVITYTDHDEMLIRTERFDGNGAKRFKISRPVVNDNYIWVQVNGIPLTAKLDYEILDDDVTVQISDEFEITSDDNIVIMSVSAQDLATTVLGYRIFNDIFNRTHFKRLSKKATTYLTKALSFTDTEIHVADATVLTQPIPSRKVPGVVIIDAERIEFFKVTGNVLSQLRRSTLGTSPSFYSQELTKVIDQSADQTIPFTETVLKQTLYTSTLTNVYTINTVTNVDDYGHGITLSRAASYAVSTEEIDSIKAAQYAEIALKMDAGKISVDLAYDLNGDGLVDLSDALAYNTIAAGNNPGFTPASTSNYLDLFVKTSVSANPINAVDQVLVYYGGRQLRKAGFYRQDTNMSYDSPEILIAGTTSTSLLLPITNVDNTAYVVENNNQVWVYNNSKETSAINGYVYKGLNYIPPEFTINTSTQQITLNIEGGLSDNIELVIIKKEFSRNNVWNDIVSDTETVSLLESTTSPARFLQSEPAELPDVYYYGGSTELTTDAGFALTDIDGDPLEGF